MTPVVTHRAYLQISKMADNLKFQMKIFHEIRQMEKFGNRFLYIVLESLSNDTINIFVTISH